VKFSNKVCKGTNLFRTYYYHCYPYQSNPPTLDERKRYSATDSFFYNLRQLPRFELRLGRLQLIKSDRGDEFKQKGIDTLLSIDLVELAATGQISKAVLVSGDSDFVPAVRRAKDKGVFIELFYSPHIYIHDELYELCDERNEIEDTFFTDCIRS